MANWLRNLSIYAPPPRTPDKGDFVISVVGYGKVAPEGATILFLNIIQL